MVNPNQSPNLWPHPGTILGSIFPPRFDDGLKHPFVCVCVASILKKNPVLAEIFLVETHKLLFSWWKSAPKTCQKSFPALLETILQKTNALNPREKNRYLAHIHTNPSRHKCSACDTSCHIIDADTAEPVHTDYESSERLVAEHRADWSWNDLTQPTALFSGVVSFCILRWLKKFARNISTRFVLGMTALLPFLGYAKNADSLRTCFASSKFAWNPISIKLQHHLIPALELKRYYLRHRSHVPTSSVSWEPLITHAQISKKYIVKCNGTFQPSTNSMFVDELHVCVHTWFYHWRWACINNS